MPYLIADGDLDPPMSRRDSSHVADERCSIAFQTAFDRPLAPPPYRGLRALVPSGMPDLPPSNHQAFLAFFAHTSARGEQNLSASARQ